MATPGTALAVVPPRGSARKRKLLNTGVNGFFVNKFVNGVETQVIASRLCTGLRAAADGEAFSGAIITLHDKAMESAVVQRVQAEEEGSGPSFPAVWAQADACVQLSTRVLPPLTRRSGFPLLVRCCMAALTAPPLAWPRLSVSLPSSRTGCLSSCQRRRRSVWCAPAPPSSSEPLAHSPTPAGYRAGLDGRCSSRETVPEGDHRGVHRVPRRRQGQEDDDRERRGGAVRRPQRAVRAEGCVGNWGD